MNLILVLHTQGYILILIFFHIYNIFDFIIDFNSHFDILMFIQINYTQTIDY